MVTRIVALALALVVCTLASVSAAEPTRDNGTATFAFMRGDLSQPRLVVDKQRVDVEMKRGEHRVVVSTYFTYAINLQKLYDDPKAMQFDAQRKRLVVKAPLVQLVGVSLVDDTLLHSKGAPVTEMLKEDYADALKKCAEKRREGVQRTGKVELKRFLEGYLTSVDKDIVVVVE